MNWRILRNFLILMILKKKRNNWDVINNYKLTFNFDNIEECKCKKLKMGLMERIYIIF